MLTYADLNFQQKQAYDAVASGESVFITGAAGTGKSEVIRVFQKESNKKVLMCAPTGMAALNCGGVTIHNAFRIQNTTFFESGEFGEDEPEWLKAYDILIIDEISMCRIDLYEYIIQTIKHYNIKMQIVCVGDFFQLPPVLEEKSAYYSKYRDVWENKLYAFQSSFWIKNMVELTEIVRTDDKEYIEYLNRIRLGDKTAVEYFNETCVNKPIADSIYICARNRQADWINKRRLLQLMEKEEFDFRSYHAIVDGRYTEEPFADEVLVLTPGMKVINVLNDRIKQLVNGDLGIVKEVKESSVIVEFEHSGTKEVGYYTRSYLDSDEKEASFSQIPLREGMAITIHKSQGQTYESVNIDPAVFAAGQLYVALSRCKSIRGLHLLKKIDPEKLLVSEEVMTFYKKSGCIVSIPKTKEQNGSSMQNYDLDKMDEEDTDDNDYDEMDEDHFECVDIKKRIGFDKITLALKLESIDFKIFPPKFFDEKKSFKCTYNKTNDSRKKLIIHKKKIPYSYIRLELV